MLALKELDNQAHSRSLLFGFVPTHYIESQSGRLYAEDVLHLQNTPREVRKLALAGKWDYDFKNCHYSILQQLAHRYGAEISAIENYVANTKAVREQLSEEIWIEIAEVKKCLLSLVYGSTQSHRKEDAIPKVIGLEKAKVLYNHPVFSALSEDVRLAGKVAIENAERVPQKDKPIVNAMRKKIAAEAPWREVLAHILQGIEAKMLHTVMELYVEEIWLLIHDGWVSERELDTALIEAEIEKETGFRMVIESEVLDPWK